MLKLQKTWASYSIITNVKLKKLFLVSQTLRIKTSWCLKFIIKEKNIWSSTQIIYRNIKDPRARKTNIKCNQLKLKIKQNF